MTNSFFKKIQKSEDPYFIAEAGINHNGSLENALKMIHIAKKSGANAIKFQTFNADQFCNDKSIKISFKYNEKKITKPLYEIFKSVELSFEEWVEVRKECANLNITFLSTPQNPNDLKLLLKLGIPVIKIGSDDFTNLPIIKEYIKTKLPLILSCGMSNLAEIFETLKFAGYYDDYPLILLLCTSQYPTPPDDVNLNKLKTLKCNFPDLILGFSDHTNSSVASSVAVAFGARVFEKHFTLDKSQYGPDHWFSEDPHSLAEWINSTKVAYRTLGSHDLIPTKSELRSMVSIKRIVVARKNIKRGEIFSNNNLTTMRSSKVKDGLPAADMLKLLGKKSLFNYKKDEAVYLLKSI